MPGVISPSPDEFTPEQIAADPILRYFAYAHLPSQLQGVSAAFCALAVAIVSTIPRSLERTVSLRKLLEAKDAGVRANVGNAKPETFLTRLADEAETLWTKMAKLKTFIDSKEFAAVSVSDREDLRRQYDAMDRYHEIVALRLDKLTPAAGINSRVDDDEAIEVKVTGNGSSETPIPFND